MTIFRHRLLASFAIAAAMLGAAGSGAAGERRGPTTMEVAAASRLLNGQQLAVRCRQICVRRQRRCHTERRCSYVTNKCRSVRVCNTTCAMYGYGPPGCTP